MNEKCQFLIGKVQRKMVIGWMIIATVLGACQFLIGKVQHFCEQYIKKQPERKPEVCQFLIGKVQLYYYDELI